MPAFFCGGKLDINLPQLGLQSANSLVQLPVKREKPEAGACCIFVCVLLEMQQQGIQESPLVWTISLAADLAVYNLHMSCIRTSHSQES